MPKAWIALGSNAPDALSQLRAAAAALALELDVTAVSPIYRTAPMYIADQPEFLNAVIRGEFEGGPLCLLRILKGCERRLGREPGLRFGPRKIDLDLLAYGRLRYSFSQDGRVLLEVPHPRMGERRFVLQPLADIDPGLQLPGLRPVAEMLGQTNRQAPGVRRVADALLPVSG